MNTTVSTESQYTGGIHIPSQTVNNIDLMDRRRNHLMISGLFIVVGVILFVSGSRSKSANGQATGENKKCPFCAELIKYEAKVCRFCGRDLPEPMQKEEISNETPVGEYRKCKYCGDDFNTPLNENCRTCGKDNYMGSTWG